MESFKAIQSELIENGLGGRGMRDGWGCCYSANTESQGLALLTGTIITYLDRLLRLLMNVVKLSLQTAPRISCAVEHTTPATAIHARKHRIPSDLRS